MVALAPPTTHTLLITLRQTPRWLGLGQVVVVVGMWELLDRY